MTSPYLIGDIANEEGFRADPYQDEKGVWTQGFGNTHGVTPQSAPVTEAQARATLALNVGAAIRQLDANLPWWRTLNDVRQDVFADMVFNMGIGAPPSPALPEGAGFLGFERMLASAKAGNFTMASAQMLMSEWADEVGDRAMRLAGMMKTGVRTP